MEQRSVESIPEGPVTMRNNNKETTICGDGTAEHLDSDSCTCLLLLVNCLSGKPVGSVPPFE